MSFKLIVKIDYERLEKLKKALIKVKSRPCDYSLLYEMEFDHLQPFRDHVKSREKNSNILLRLHLFKDYFKTTKAHCSKTQFLVRKIHKNNKSYFIFGSRSQIECKVY